ncbi:MAG: hypothetical protein ABI675_21580 [Chitinophagaceae bacterium]
MKYPVQIQFLGSLLFIAGFAINYAISRRKFNRRVITGAEGFRSYETARVIVFAERILRLIARLMIAAGVVVFLVTIL